MKISILTSGSRGDVQPFVALGVALKTNGHSVTIATHENYASFILQHGLEFFPIHGDVSKIASSDELKGAHQADNPLKILLSFNKLRTLATGMQGDFFNACKGADVIVYHPGPAIGYFAAQHFGIPSVLATPFPMTPTKEYPALIFYDRVRLGKVFNLFSHKIFEKIMWLASNSTVKQFLKKELGSLPRDYACPFPKQNTAALPTVVSCSRYVFPEPKDWPEGVHSTGYWFLADDANWKPSRELLKFIDHGNPPVYVGFGSIGSADGARQTTHMVIQALQEAGQRGILATGWSGMVKVEDVPESIHILESAPHSWLFPHMAAVAHHGGAGTTAAGLRAGVPSIIVPFSLDHFAWGRRVFELGVGPHPVPRKKLTAGKLAQAISEALAPEKIKAAGELGEKIRSEQGAEEAARIIGSLAKKP